MYLDKWSTAENPQRDYRAVMLNRKVLLAQSGGQPKALGHIESQQAAIGQINKPGPSGLPSVERRSGHSR